MILYSRVLNIQMLHFVVLILYYCIIISFKTIPCNIVKEFPNQFVSKENSQSKFVNLRIIRSLTVKYTKQQYFKHAIHIEKMLNGIR